MCQPSLNPNTIETTGAGDTFCACSLSYVLEHDLNHLTKEGLKDMLTFANAAASLITTRKGALRVMPTREEVLEYMENVSARREKLASPVYLKTRMPVFLFVFGFDTDSGKTERPDAIRFILPDRFFCSIKASPLLSVQPILPHELWTHRPQTSKPQPPLPESLSPDLSTCRRNCLCFCSSDRQCSFPHHPES